MSRFLGFVTLLALFTFAVQGCTSSDTPAVSTPTAEEPAAVGKICGHCGDAKGSESCCSESAEKCDGCGKNAGSALCCVELDEAATGQDMCGKCGHVAGSEVCCAEGAEKCECGMAKGSPLCCKLKKAE